MDKTKVQLKQPLFDMHLEYSAAASQSEKEYRDLENRFFSAVGYLPTRIEDDIFVLLSPEQQDICRAFWNNIQVLVARKAMIAARTLSEMYFNAYVDSGKGQWL